MPLDPADIGAILLLTLEVTAGATAFGAALGIPLALLLSMRSRGAVVARSVIYGLFAFPPVVAGVLVYLLLRGSGPAGALHLLFSPLAIILAESLLTIPLVAGLTLVALEEVPSSVSEAIECCGANHLQHAQLLLFEARAGVASAVMVGYGRALAEVAAAILVGGNIHGETQTLATAIFEQVQLGDLQVALALGGILVAQAIIVAALIHLLNRRNRRFRQAAP